MTPQLVAALVAGAVGLAGVTWTVRQRDRADRRDQWWKRAAWAVDHTLEDNDDAQAIGFDVLALLEKSKLIGSDERALVNAFSSKRGSDSAEKIGDTLTTDVEEN